MDISGFTPMTERLMNFGKEGAEILNSILNRIFQPVIDAVYQRDGYISTFSGDALTSLFPIDKENKDFTRALYAAVQIIEIFKQLSFHKTKAGDFNFFVKIGMSFGSVNWNIDGSKNKKIYYFKSNSLKRSCLAEHRAKDGDIILDRYLYFKVNDKINIKKLDKNFYFLK